MSTVTSLEHTAIGALSGLLEVCIMQPTVGVKNALQEGRPVPRSIPALYRGLGMNAGAMLPITSVQFGANRFLEQAYERVAGQRPGFGGNILVAMGAGATSSLLGCPAEFVVIHQQKSGRSLPSELSHIMKTYGPLKLYKGLTSTALRESLYVASYLGLFPVIRGYLQDSTPAGGVPGAPLALSGIITGTIGTLATQPADTVKTRMQAFPDAARHPHYRTMLSTVQHIGRSEGVAGFFAGTVPRGLRICGAVIILNTSRSAMVDAVEARRTGGQQGGGAAEVFIVSVCVCWGGGGL